MGNWALEIADILVKIDKSLTSELEPDMINYQKKVGSFLAEVMKVIAQNENKQIDSGRIYLKRLKLRQRNEEQATPILHPYVELKYDTSHDNCIITFDGDCRDINQNDDRVKPLLEKIRGYNL